MDHVAAGRRPPRARAGTQSRADEDDMLSRFTEQHLADALAAVAGDEEAAFTRAALDPLKARLLAERLREVVRLM